MVFDDAETHQVGSQDHDEETIVHKRQAETDLNTELVRATMLKFCSGAGTRQGGHLRRRMAQEHEQEKH